MCSGIKMGKGNNISQVWESIDRLGVTR
jgi:hypothetical protein